MVIAKHLASIVEITVCGGNLMTQENYLDLVKKIERSAFHEVGHLIIHEIFGLGYRDLRIIKIEHEGGSINFEGNLHSEFGEEFLNTTSPELIDKLRYACICLAGSVAEEKYLYPNNDPTWGLLLATGFSDFNEYNKLNLKNHYKKFLKDITKEIITETWESISKIASILVEKKKLKLEQFEQIWNSQEIKQFFVPEEKQILVNCGLLYTKKLELIPPEIDIQECKDIQEISLKVPEMDGLSPSRLSDFEFPQNNLQPRV